MPFRFLTLLTAAFLLTACGRDVVVGGYRGDVRTVATSGDAEGPSAARAPADPANATTSPVASKAQGTIELTASVALIDEAGHEVPLTDGLATGRFRIEGADSVRLGERSVPAGRYGRVRLRFARVAAEVSGGVVVGGINLTGPITVGISGAPLVVEAPVEFVVEAGTSRTLVLDLNADAWLPTADPFTRVAPPTSFTAALRVRVL
jgi:hypothetical protein